MWSLLKETASIPLRKINGDGNVEEVFHCVWSESLSEHERTLRFAAIHVGVNVAFAHAWFGNE